MDAPLLRKGVRKHLRVDDVAKVRELISESSQDGGAESTWDAPLLQKGVRKGLGVDDIAKAQLFQGKIRLG